MALAQHGPLLLLTALGTTQTFTRGCLSVLSVVLAIDVLGTGEPGVGVLGAAVGLGAVAGSVPAFLFIRAGRLAGWFGLGVALWGAPWR